MTTPKEISLLDSILKKGKLHYNPDCIILSEPDPSAKLKTVNVNGLSSDFIALKPDDCNYDFFQRGYANKQCDYILLSEFENRKVAVFVEMKSNVSPHDAEVESPVSNSHGQYASYVQQLRGSNCLFDLLVSVLSNFFKCSFLGEEYTRFYVVLYYSGNIPPIHEPVLLTRVKPNTSPEDAYIRPTDNNEQLTLRNLIR